MDDLIEKLNNLNIDNTIEVDDIIESIHKLSIEEPAIINIIQHCMNILITKHKCSTKNNHMTIPRFVF